MIEKKSTDLIVGKDLPRKADVVVSEILSADFVKEGVRSTTRDANDRLLKETGKMIPGPGKIKIALLRNSSELCDKIYVGTVEEFDL